MSGIVVSGEVRRPGGLQGLLKMRAACKLAAQVLEYAGTLVGVSPSFACLQQRLLS